MKNLNVFFLLKCILIFSISNAQIEIKRVYDLEDPIISVSNKQYLFYALNKKGIKNLAKNYIISDNDIISFCLSPLGNELVTISNKMENDTYFIYWKLNGN